MRDWKVKCIRFGKVPEIAGEEDGLSGRRCLEEGEIVQVRQRHG